MECFEFSFCECMKRPVHSLYVTPLSQLLSLVGVNAVIRRAYQARKIKRAFYLNI